MHNEIMRHFDEMAEDYESLHLNLIDKGIFTKKKIVKYFPKNPDRILDLGAGTGLELEFIFEKFPTAFLHCIDISEKMLEKLKLKYSYKRILTINADYFEFEFQENYYDCVFSSMSLHHFTKNEKTLIYEKAYKSLKEGGIFINCDIIFNTLAQEMETYEKHILNKKADGLSDNFDIPLCLASEIEALKSAGFKRIKVPYNTKQIKILVSKKH